MGPLVPDIISNELNFIVALVIGVAFGIILEQAGFSTSKKLVGLFYGYDFTVLRVFFTAGITAMFGVIALTHYGFLDIGLVYINPTFLWSALAGGLIMGLGFILGGYCPGTSFCGAAIGKIDAMVFIAGAFLGVYIFAEGYPMFEDLYKAANLGSPQIFETLRMSQGLFAFLLIVMAVGAFWAASIIERKVNKVEKPDPTPARLFVPLTAVAVVLGIIAIFLPEKKASLLADVKDKEYVSEYQFKMMTPDELVFRILDEDKKYVVIDTRDEKAFAAFTLPGAVNITPAQMFEKQSKKQLNVRGKKYVIVADDEQAGIAAAVVAMNLGVNEVSVLAGGLDAIKSQILNYQTPTDLSTRQAKDTDLFRKRAKVELAQLIEKNKNKKVVKKEVKRVLGGC